jgi:hypothetical protein
MPQLAARVNPRGIADIDTGPRHGVSFPDIRGPPKNKVK